MTLESSLEAVQKRANPEEIRIVQARSGSGTQLPSLSLMLVSGASALRRRYRAPLVSLVVLHTTLEPSAENARATVFSRVSTVPALLRLPAEELSAALALPLGSTLTNRKVPQPSPATCS